MTDNEKFHEEIQYPIDHLEGIDIPDPDQEALVSQALDLLRRADDLAIDRIS